MRGSNFVETLRREWRSVLLWSFGFFGYGMLTVGILPDAEGMQQMSEALGAVPNFVWQMIGIQDVSVLATVSGFISFRFFLTASMLLSVWAVISGMNVTLNEEVNGISNMVFSLPASRTRVIVEKLAAYVPLAVIIPVSGLLGLVIGMSLNTQASTDIAPLVLSTIAMVPVAVLIVSFTAFVASVMPRKVWVASIAGGFVAVSFFLNSIGGMLRSDLGTAMQQFSVFHHSDASRVLLNGFPLIAALVTLIVAAALVAASTRLFTRRDLAG